MNRPGEADVLVAARSTLLDALEALADQRAALVLVGAQAIHLHTGDTPVALAEAPSCKAASWQAASPMRPSSTSNNSSPPGRTHSGRTFWRPSRAGAERQLCGANGLGVVTAVVASRMDPVRASRSD